MDKITYASLATLGEDVHQAFDAALSYELKKIGRVHALYMRRQKKKAKTGLFKDTSPADSRIVLGEFQSGGREETRQAIEAAQAAVPDWRELGWQQRVAFLRKAAELINERRFRLAALLSLEVGKNRFEAISEVAESIDLIHYYCRQIEAHHGYVIPMGGTGKEQTKSVLRPYGVWAVVSPFNFPLALATGMVAGALLAGNTVVFKPASDTPLAGVLLHEILQEAGLPVGVANLVTGPGSTVGEELVANPEVDGFIFTGSKAVGLEILRRFNQSRLRPCIVEMGGKNPTIVMPSANLDDATEGVLRSVFGMGGQNCSACSRVYLHQNISGGNRLKEFDHGFFVEPTIIDRAPKTSRLFQEEFFVPVLAVAEIKSLDEAIALANDGEYGLTAGIFSQEEHEQETFFDSIQVGVAYCNRRGGATSGAWPGVQSLAGWKQSGSSGKGALGPYYVAQFLREQSQTRVK